MTHATAVVGTVAGVLYLISYVDDRNHTHKMKVYHLNVLTLFAMFIGLGADIVYQLLIPDHLCSEKYTYTDHFGKQAEIPCDKITMGICIAGLILCCFIPLFRMAMESIYRYAASCQVEELRDEGADEEINAP